MIQVAIRRIRKLKGTEADVVKCLVIDAIGLVSVLYKLVNGEGGVVWFNDCIRHLGRWNDAKTVHDSVGKFFANLGDEQRTHTRSGATAERVCQLEALEAVAVLSLFSYYVQNGVYQFSSFCVVTLGPVVTSSALTCKLEKSMRERERDSYKTDRWLHVHRHRQNSLL